MFKMSKGEVATKMLDFQGLFVFAFTPLTHFEFCLLCRKTLLTLTPVCCRYYFKKASDEFECGAVFEEVSDDSSLLPTYKGKILGKVERME